MKSWIRPSISDIESDNDHASEICVYLTLREKEIVLAVFSADRFQDMNFLLPIVAWDQILADSMETGKSLSWQQFFGTFISMKFQKLLEILIWSLRWKEDN